jgi:hypothetical protein
MSSGERVPSFRIRWGTPAHLSCIRFPTQFSAFLCDRERVPHRDAERCANGYASRAVRQAIRWSNVHGSD